jgi:hypothetical protein
MSRNPPTPPPGQSGDAPASRRIEIADLGRFDDTAAAFSTAFDQLCGARGPFVAAVGALGNDLGDPRLAMQHDRSFVQMLRTLDALEACFQQFSHLLAAAGRSYQQADDAVVDGVP